MIIDVLVCNSDGTQLVERREVPDDYFSAGEPEVAPGYDERLSQIEELIDGMTGGALLAARAANMDAKGILEGKNG